MRRTFVLPAVVALSAVLAACGSSQFSSPTLDNGSSTTKKQPQQAEVTPYYLYAENTQLRLLSGSRLVPQDNRLVPDGRLYVQNKQTGKYSLLTTPTEFGENFYSDGGVLSPDGQTAYTVVNANGSWAINAIDLQSGQVTKLFDSESGGPTVAEGITLAISPNGRQLAFRGYTLSTDVQAERVNRTHEIYVLSVATNINTQNIALRGMPIQSKDRPVVPTFNAQGQLVESNTTPYQLSTAVTSGFKAQTLGVVGRLPFAGTAALTQSFHGSGYAGGTSWGLGLDFGPRPQGTQMAARAITTGTVRNVLQTGCGVYVIIAHSGINYDTYYCHLVSGSPEGYSIRAGNSVYEGQTIGTIGMTGANALHLHLAIIQGDTFGLRGRDPTRTGCNISDTNWVVGREYSFLGSPC